MLDPGVDDWFVAMGHEGSRSCPRKIFSCLKFFKIRTDWKLKKTKKIILKKIHDRFWLMTVRTMSDRIPFLLSGNPAAVFGFGDQCIRRDLPDPENEGRVTRPSLPPSPCFRFLNNSLYFLSRPIFRYA